MSAVSVEASNPTVISHVYRLSSPMTATKAARRRPCSSRPGTSSANPARFPGATRGRHEVEFYHRVAVTPRRAYSPVLRRRTGTSTGAWHLLLEDLTDTHAIASQWPFPPTLADSEAIIRTLARFHAAWWDDPRLGTSVGTWANRRPAEFQQKCRGGKEARRRLGDRLAPERLAFYERLFDRAAPFRALPLPLQHDGRARRCACLELLSAARTEPGTPKLFDWDSWRLDNATDDLAYKMALHWYPDLRRQRERHLLDVYHDELQARGVTGYDRQALQNDYRLSVLGTTMTPVWQHAGNVPAWIWWSHLARIHLAADDLGCRELLGGG